MPTHAVVLRVVLVVAIVLGLFAGSTGHARTAGAQTVSVFGELGIVRPNPTGGDFIYGGKVEATTDTVAHTATVRVHVRSLNIDTTITRPLLPNGGFRGQVQLADGTRVLVRGRPVAGAVLAVRFFSNPVIGTGPAPGGAFLVRVRLRTDDPNDPPGVPTFRMERTATQRFWGSSAAYSPPIELPVPLTVEILGELTNSPTLRLTLGTETVVRNATVTDRDDQLNTFSIGSRLLGGCSGRDYVSWSIDLAFSKNPATGQIIRLERVRVALSTYSNFLDGTGACKGWVWTSVYFSEDAPYPDD